MILSAAWHPPLDIKAPLFQSKEKYTLLTGDVKRNSSATKLTRRFTEFILGIIGQSIIQRRLVNIEALLQEFVEVEK